MSVWLGLACPTCAAQPDELCWDLQAFATEGKWLSTANTHPERVEAAAFVTSLGQPAEDRVPATDADILATGEV